MAAKLLPEVGPDVTSGARRRVKVSTEAKGTLAEFVGKAGEVVSLTVHRPTGVEYAWVEIER